MAFFTGKKKRGRRNRTSRFRFFFSVVVECIRANDNFIAEREREVNRMYAHTIDKRISGVNFSPPKDSKSEIKRFYCSPFSRENSACIRLKKKRFPVLNIFIIVIIVITIHNE
ncbi:hypothetical protein BDF21DRAFT_417174 [Thamnidium elegans]|nr:hypothetical protein BDF21DRAFT_417174 [Thamnidium elegans]